MKMGLYDIQTKTEPFMKESCVKGLRKSPTRKESHRRERSHRYQMLQRTELIRRRMAGRRPYKKQEMKQPEER